MKEITTLLFDFDNTLTDFNEASHAAFSEIHERYDLPLESQHYARYSRINRAVWGKFEKGEIDSLDVRRMRFSEYLRSRKIDHIDPLQMNADYLAGILKHTQLFEGVLPALEKLSERFVLGIITNGLHEIQRKRIHRTGLQPKMSAITVSDEIGVAKPAPGCFDHAFAQIEAEPEQTLMIGDGLSSDIIGGKKYGMQTCWIQKKKGRKSQYADYYISEARQVIDLLRL